MSFTPNTIIVNTPKELGNLARAKRMEAGFSLRKTAALNHLGIRFLSEFERGKPTSEIGKIIAALHAAKLDLAVVPRAAYSQSDSTKASTMKNNDSLSRQLQLEFPYDWSNPQMDETTFIRLVLEKIRFNDILRVTHYFGFERVASEAKKLSGIPQAAIINKLLDRIRIGIQRARSKI